MHVETPDGWDLDVERVSSNAWELPFAAWVTNPFGFVMAFGRGTTDGRAATAALLDLRAHCSEAEDEVDDLVAASRSYVQNPPGRRTVSPVDGLPRPSRRKTDRSGQAVHS